MEVADLIQVQVAVTAVTVVAATVQAEAEVRRAIQVLAVLGVFMAQQALEAVVVVVVGLLINAPAVVAEV